MFLDLGIASIILCGVSLAGMDSFSLFISQKVFLYPSTMAEHSPGSPQSGVASVVFGNVECMVYY